MRTKLIAGNWKMNLSFNEAKDLFTNIQSFEHNDKSLAVCIPSCYLSAFTSAVDPFVFAQDVSAHPKGAFTGEVSAAMLASLNATGSLVGHSERRQYHNETSAILKQKINQLLENNLVAIYCVGETLQERNDNALFTVIETQINEVLGHLSSEQMKLIIIAYEPVWAIGTGVTASTTQAQEMHAFIRNCIQNLFGTECAENIKILYGGSMNAANAKELLSCPDVDGGLIGGASLKADDFRIIYES
ncbi:MAG: triose-phosphate isomerase [Bacteroidota bacterium]